MSFIDALRSKFLYALQNYSFIHLYLSLKMTLYLLKWMSMSQSNQLGNWLNQLGFPGRACKNSLLLVASV